MNGQRIPLCAGVLALVLAAAVQAQSYEVTRYTVDGGGVMFASGGGYEVGATIGQPDAGEMTGGVYVVAGGFWTPTATSSVKRPMAEDCATIAPGNRCDTFGMCSADADCADESRCVLPPMGEPGFGVCYAPKLRYLSIARNLSQPEYTARRIELDDGTPIGWVGEPHEDGAGFRDTYWIAEVVPAPYHAQTWPDVVHVYGCGIAPTSLCDVSGVHCRPNGCPNGETCVTHMYGIQAILSGVDIGDEDSYSEALWLNTSSTWGDTVSNCQGDVCKPPDGVVGLADIMAAIKTFQGVDVAPIPWLDIAPSGGGDTPDRNVGLGDVMACISGFQGGAYTGDGPINCP